MGGGATRRESLLCYEISQRESELIEFSGRSQEKSEKCIQNFIFKTESFYLTTQTYNTQNHNKNLYSSGKLKSHLRTDFLINKALQIC